MRIFELLLWNGEDNKSDGTNLEPDLFPALFGDGLTKLASASRKMG